MIGFSGIRETVILKSPVWMVLGVSGAAVSGGIERRRDRVIERKRDRLME